MCTFAAATSHGSVAVLATPPRTRINSASRRNESTLPPPLVVVCPVVLADLNPSLRDVRPVAGLICPQLLPPPPAMRLTAAVALVLAWSFTHFKTVETRRGLWRGMPARFFFSVPTTHCVMTFVPRVT